MVSLCWRAFVATDEAEPFLVNLRKSNPSLVLQLVSAAPPPSAAAIEMVAAQTLRAVETGATLAQRPEMDLLLRLAGTKQIGEAIASMGYKTGGRERVMVLVAAGPEKELEALRRRLDADSRFQPLVKRELTKRDLDLVEKAALLGAEA